MTAKRNLLASPAFLRPICRVPEQPAEQPTDDHTPEYWRWCPRCGSELHNEKCKFRCPKCHYYMSCSDFD